MRSLTNFTAGIILGTVAGLGAMLVINPMDKKDMYRNCCKANRIIKKMNRKLNRSINSAMHNFM